MAAMCKVLLQDIVIPAGTVFTNAPTEVRRNGGHIEAVIATSRNTSAFVTIDVDYDNFGVEIAHLFADLKMPGKRNA